MKLELSFLYCLFSEVIMFRLWAVLALLLVGLGLSKFRVWILEHDMWMNVIPVHVLEVLY